MSRIIIDIVITYFENAHSVVSILTHEICNDNVNNDSGHGNDEKKKYEVHEYCPEADKYTKTNIDEFKSETVREKPFEKHPEYETTEIHVIHNVSGI